MTQIKLFLQKFRRKKANQNLYASTITLIIGTIYTLLFLGTLEAVFYFNNTIRIKIAIYFLLFLLSSICYLVIRYILNLFSIFDNSSDNKLAKEVKLRSKFINDRLFNALQLENSLHLITKGNDLAEHAISIINKDIKTISIKSLYDPIKPKVKNFIKLTFFITIIIIFTFSESLLNSYNRLFQPNKNFPIPKPFILNSLSGNIKILGGDTAKVSVAGYGDLPDSILIFWQQQENINKISITQKDEVYEHTFLNITKDIYYWAEFKSQNFFSPWNVIATKKDTIFVKDRPVIKDLYFTILPPNYTNLVKYQHPGNITDISVPLGSRLEINGISSKNLIEAWTISNIKHNLNVNMNKFQGGLYIGESSNMSINVKDDNNVNNINPPYYRISVINDAAPDLIIRIPDKNFELDESNEIIFDIQTSDDYGFSNCWIEYRIKAPEYLHQDTTIYKKNILQFEPNVKSQQVYYKWKIDKLKLAPDDKLIIRVAIADNNILTGPSITYSKKLIGYYPSIDDLFNKIKEEEDIIEEYNEDIQINIEDVKEFVEELELELLKSENISWEQEQKVSETLEKMDEIFEQVDDIQQTMQKIQEQAEKNNLVSEQLVEKFSDFQELLDDIMTPEMLEAMEKMQEAMKEMDPQKMLDALEDFEFDLEAFEEQLDRFIEMFELALAEQKMDEVIKRLEKLVEEQSEIVQELDQNLNVDLNELSSRERRQEENFKNLKETMKEASEAMQNLSPDASEDLLQLLEDELTKSTADNLNKARTDMQNQDQSSALKPASDANNNLSEMLEITQNIQSDFQEDTVDEMLRKFLSLIRNLLYISQQQELLIKDTEGLRSRSPKLIEAAVKQDRILRYNQKFILQLTNLSRETFHISPQIASAIGKTKTAMDKTISKLEQKQASVAKKEMNNILSGLNEIANLLLESANEMQMTGSGSGMAQFMEQMEQMSKQQQGINQSTMNLPQLGMMAQQQMMEQLQKQQEELKQQLEELLQENPGQESGGLSKANQDMEEVIDDFRKRQVDRRTQERQQRILSRMLDSQKSLTQKDYSEKRKSNSGEDIIFSGPLGLPTDKGEKQLLIINAMESALQEGHSREYQQMIKQYFRSLQKGQEENEK